MKRSPGWMLILAAALIAGAGGAEELRPNVILISVDTLRADHLSCYGYSRTTTPNLDQLAEKGVKFLDVTSAIPLTNPALSALLTSLPPSQTGVTRNGLSLRPEHQTLAELLRDQGYITAAVVSSWPLHGSRSGLARGFDYYYDRLARKYYLGMKIERDARWVTRQAEARLAAGLPEPFFLWVHYADPHRPHLTQSDYRFHHPPGENSKQARVEDRYDSEIVHTDRWIGVLLDDLERRSLHERSLIIVLSDHGESLGDQHFFGHGRRLYQSILHIPLILVGPELPAGKEVSAPVHMLDIAPTILDYLRLPPVPNMTGQSLLAAVSADQHPEPKPMFYETYGVAVPGLPGLKKRWSQAGPVVIAMRLGPLKIIYSFRHRQWELYNLEEDPKEEHNLFDPDDPEIRVLADQLMQWYQARYSSSQSPPGL